MINKQIEALNLSRLHFAANFSFQANGLINILPFQQGCSDSGENYHNDQRSDKGFPDYFTAIVDDTRCIRGRGLRPKQ